jgi:hypothetical protein
VQPPAPALPEEQPESGPSQPFIDPIDDLPPLYPSHKRRREVNPEPLRALSTLAWPPEADPKIYTDPLTRDDPKPLRRSELMAIGEFVGHSKAHLSHLASSTEKLGGYLTRPDAAYVTSDTEGT